MAKNQRNRRPTLVDSIAHLGPCSEARAWLATQPDAATAWAACERPDWLLWLLGRLSGERDSPARRQLVSCACECARTALRYVPEGEERPLRCIETAERWARGEPGVTIDDVLAALSAAADAANAAAYAAATAAAATAATAATAAYATAADAADAAAAARQKARLEMCAIIRRHYPEPPEVSHAR